MNSHQPSTTEPNHDQPKEPSLIAGGNNNANEEEAVPDKAKKHNVNDVAARVNQLLAERIPFRHEGLLSDREVLGAKSSDRPKFSRSIPGLQHRLKDCQGPTKLNSSSSNDNNESRKYKKAKTNIALWLKENGNKEASIGSDDVTSGDGRGRHEESSTTSPSTTTTNVILIQNYYNYIQTTTTTSDEQQGTSFISSNFKNIADDPKVVNAIKTLTDLLATKTPAVDNKNDNNGCDIDNDDATMAAKYKHNK